MYYKDYKQMIEDEKLKVSKNEICEHVLNCLFSVIGTTEQFKLTGEDSEFLKQCFQNVKQRIFEDGCVAGYRSCIKDHMYNKEQHRVKTDIASIKKIPNNFKETIMQRFMKRT